MDIFAMSQITCYPTSLLNLLEFFESGCTMYQIHRTFSERVHKISKLEPKEYLVEVLPKNKNLDVAELKSD